MRAQEATPIVIDGVMYTSGTWGYVYAVDAVSGRELWRFDPKADYFAARNPCCDLINRGVAVWKGKVYVASVDGHLHALNAATGAQLWEADTIVDHSLPYSSNPMRILNWRPPTRPGIRTASRSSRAARRCGTDSPTTPN
jgi:quinohemoprotein ethanol dehydrogenase